MNITVVACMKNEGPFLLEWLAHHRAIGVNRFIIFSNDCTDGTAELLNALDDAGIVRHLENPNRVANSERRIDVAFYYAQYLKEYQRADYVALIDADEFINVKTEDGLLTTAIAGMEPFDFLSLNHVNFGFGGVTEYDPAPITEQFFLTSGAEIGVGPKGRTAIKTIHRVRDDVIAANHFPRLDTDKLEELVWRDGSGQQLGISPQKPRRKMLRARRRTGIIQLNHYVLRSVESCMVKFDRGSVFGTGEMNAKTYTGEYNHNRIEDRSILATHQVRQDEMDALKGIPEVARWHGICVKRHRARIAELRESAEGKALFKLLAAEALAGYPEDAGTPPTRQSA